MKALLRILAALLLAAAAHAFAGDAAPAQLEFVPKGGSGRVVVLVSGKSGAAAYAHVAQQVADAGYYAVLVDGNDFPIKEGAGWPAFRDVVARAQASPHAQPGKVGVVGFSLGGGFVLTFATRMPAQVATVVAQYPLTRFIQDPADFVGKIKVPTLMLAGTADTYENCCLIAKARQLADAARAASPPLLALHEYEGVGHGFDLDTARRQDLAAGADAMERTLAQLKQAFAQQP